MAKKASVTKTQAVAEYLKAHRKAMSSEIAEALTKEGISITASHAANIKSKLKRLRRARRAKARKSEEVAAAASAPAAEAKPSKIGDMITLDQIKKVAQTVKTIGGFEPLHDMLSVIKEVGGLRKFKDLLEAMSLTEPGKIPF